MPTRRIVRWLRKPVRKDMGLTVCYVCAKWLGLDLGPFGGEHSHPYDTPFTTSTRRETSGTPTGQAVRIGDARGEPSSANRLNPVLGTVPLGR